MTDVLFLPIGDRSWASTRYRVLYLVPELEKHGINCSILNPIKWSRLKPLGNSVESLRNVLSSARYDIVVLQKYLPSTRDLNALTKINSNLIYDFDDAIYARKPWKSDIDTERKEKLDRTLNAVQYVTAGNPILADYASNYCSEVFVAPTAIPKNRYSRYQYRSANDQKVVIGWIGNEENLWYLNRIAEPLRVVLSSYSSVELNIVTSPNRPVTPLEERIGEDVQYIQWSEERELEFLNEFDIGIRPLTHDEWSRAKGGFTSVVQCMAMGIPMIVTPAGMLSDIVPHGECGYHAEEPEEWIDYLSNLIDQPERIVSMGNRAVKRVGEQRFWTHQRAEDLAEIFEEISQK